MLIFEEIISHIYKNVLWKTLYNQLEKKSGEFCWLLMNQSIYAVSWERKKFSLSIISEGKNTVLFFPLIFDFYVGFFKRKCFIYFQTLITIIIAILLVPEICSYQKFFFFFFFCFNVSVKIQKITFFFFLFWYTPN